MTSFKYGSAHSQYFYPGTQILKNNLDIQEEKLLEEAEILYTSQRLLELDLHPLVGNLDLENLKQIHKYIFQDIYPFAGQIREEDISKGGFMFAKFQFIIQNAEPIFLELKLENYLRDLSSEGFAKRAAHYMAEVNVLHPFREGNGRATREFIRCLALNNKFELNWNSISRDELLEASINSVTNETALYECIKKCIQ